MDKDELLVILNNSAGEKARDYLRTHCHVRQEGSGRVFVVDRPQNMEALEELPDVQWVTSTEVPADVRETLDLGEDLFVQAWLQQPQIAEKKRRGEGLSWDAKGYEAPGPPTPSDDH